MDHQLAVLVQTDVGGACVRLLVTEYLTEASQQALYPLIRRARILFPPVAVTVDLTAAAQVEAAGVELLRRVVDRDGTIGGVGPVDIFLPAELPDHPSGPYRMTRHRQGLGWSPA
ncbi:hypothetical protein GCM10009696_08970 [Kocuria himachalensis]